MVRGEVAAKGTVLLQLRGSQPKNFSQIGNHVLRISLRCREGKLEGFATNCTIGIAKMVVC